MCNISYNFTAGSVSATEDIIEKHLKVMDKIDKKKNDVKAIIAKGEKLESMPKAPVSVEDSNNMEFHLKNPRVSLERN